MGSPVAGRRGEGDDIVGKEKAMPDHIHTWEFEKDGAIVCRLHSNGIWVMNKDDAERRLNAMERLEKLIADLQDANDGPNEMGGPFVALSVIASALEGEDAPS